MNIRVKVGEFRVDDETMGAVNRVLGSGRASEGKETKELEASFESTSTRDMRSRPEQLQAASGGHPHSNRTHALSDTEGLTRMCREEGTLRIG